MGIFKRKCKSFRLNSHFLPILVKQSEFADKAADALSRMMETTEPVEWQRREKEVKQCEIQGDAILAEFYEELYETYVPLMDREDIQTVAMNIDIFLDQINTSAKSLMLYLPDRIDQQLVDLSLYIKKEAEALKNIFSLMDNMKDNFSSISMQCDRITELEHAADDSYEEYIGEIFRNEKNAIELMKYKNIAEVLESATDAAKKISDHIRKLLLRYI